MSLEEEVRQRCEHHGISASLIPQIIESLFEAKALGTLSATGRKGTPDKAADVAATRRQTNFMARQRGHARAAGDQLSTIIKQIGNHIVNIINDYQSGEMSYDKMRRRASIAFKENAKEIFRLGMKASGLVKAGGSLYDLSAAEEKWLESYVKQELKYFDKFLGDVIGGIPDKELYRRASAYADSMRSIYHAGRVMAVGTDDVLIYWTLESRNPCPDCRLIAKYNPYSAATLPTTPKAGSTRCRNHCYCTIRMEKSTPEAVQKAMKSKGQRSTKWLLDKLKKQQKRK